LAATNWRQPAPFRAAAMRAETDNAVRNIIPVEDQSAHLAAIVESTDDAVISKDLNGIIRSWNPAAERIFGYTAAEAIGRPITILIPEGNYNEEPRILALIRRGRKVDHYQTIRRRKDGSMVNISLTVSPIRNAEGKVVGASKIARDITAQKRIERKMRQARDELARLNAELDQRVRERTASLNEVIAQMEEFSYSISHDLRSPNRAMQAFATVVLDDYGSRLDDTGRDYLQRIIRSSVRMDKLISDLLSYSRLSRTEIQTQPVALDPLISDIIQHYPEMQPPRAQFIIHSPLNPVMAHEASLTQALSNLMANAVKFVRPGITPRVDISSQLSGKTVRVFVRDNGIGIKREHLSRLFGMFERVIQDARFDGTGIGLAIVRKAIERMNGTVGVESDGLSGTTFWIDLPAPAAP
jgi:PAS domain S-box-containing protein